MNITNVKVSVCIPVYGVEKYIERCARSLFEQTMTDGIEFIFVNDCTKDRSIEILEQVLSEYPQRKDQVKIIHHEKNGGLVAARNTGLKHANGDYIIHCDSDDWVDVNMYETMYNKAIETDADVVCCDIVFIAENKIIKRCNYKYCDDVQAFIKDFFYSHEYNHLWNKMFKRVIACNTPVDKLDIVMGEDLLRTSFMLMKCNNIVFLPDIRYFYRMNPASITKQFKMEYHEQLLEIICILEKILPCDLHYLLDRIRAEILWETLVHNKTYAREFKHLWNSEFWNTARNNILRDKNLHIVQKMFFLLASINYTFACSVYNLLRR